MSYDLMALIQGCSKCLSLFIEEPNNSFETPKIALASLANPNRAAPAAG